MNPLNLGRLDPYVESTFARATSLALRFHADELTVEHLFATILEDEDCAATRLIVHAFADPESILAEVVALCPGTMMVGSERSLPFSVLGAQVLDAARSDAAERRHANVTVAHLFAAAIRVLDRDIQAALNDAGFEGSSIDAGDEGGADGIEWPDVVADSVPADGPLLKHFTSDARRALSTGARTAQSLQRDAISPAHVVIGCLEQDVELARQTGLRVSLVRQAIAGRDDDKTPVPERPLPPSDELVELVGSLPDGAGTLAILAALVRAGSEELRLLLGRQRVTAKLLERAGDAFRDPRP